MIDTNTFNADLSEWRVTGDPDVSGLSAPLKEAIIREYFANDPWIVVFALEMQGVHYVDDLDDIAREATDSYQGEWNDLEDYAVNAVESAYEDVLESLPGFIRYHVDYEGIGRDMLMGGEIYVYTTGAGSVYVFNTSW